MSLKMKLNIVNKYEYQDNENYREIVIKIPEKSEKLERDFKYLGLDYNNLSIQDTHILDCKVIETEDPYFSELMTTKLLNIIDRASESGETTPYQDIKSMFSIIKTSGSKDRDKLLAVLEIKREQIVNMKDAVKYGNNLECFKFFNNINTYEEYAQEMIDNQDVSLEDVTDYINLLELGEAYVNGNDGIFTKHGLIFETDSIDGSMQNTIKNMEEKEEEGEFC